MSCVIHPGHEGEITITITNEETGITVKSEICEACWRRVFNDFDNAVKLVE